MWLENGSITLARFALIWARLVIQRHLRRRLLVISRIYILIVGFHTFESIIFPSISESLKVWMEKKFEEEEKVALAECRDDKALGSDGCNFFLFVRIGIF